MPQFFLFNGDVEFALVTIHSRLLVPSLVDLSGHAFGIEAAGRIRLTAALKRRHVDIVSIKNFSISTHVGVGATYLTNIAASR